jgi:hypothetical protein
VRLVLFASLLCAFCSAQSTVTLNGTVSDDGLPNNTLTISWSKVSGPGTVVFANPAAAVTTATLSAAGTYILRLTASDGELSASDDVTVTITVPNKPPVVNAGPDVSGVMAAAIPLKGTISDDGKPSGVLTARWSMLSGPGNAMFSDPLSALSSVTFDKQGNYALRLTASDGILTASDDVLVAVKRR